MPPAAVYFILAACLSAALFFFFRITRLNKNLQRIKQYARSLAAGTPPPAVRGLPQPFIGLASDIEALAAGLREGAKDAVEEKNRLSAILESMAEGVLVVDTAQKVLLVNAALARDFGFDAASAAGRFFWEIFRDSDINEMIQAALRDRAAIRREHVLILSESVFEIQISPIYTQSDFLGTVAVFRDITVLKEFDRLRTEFVANVSHELKTPLTSILGFVETLKEGAMEDAENRLKFLQIIETQSKKLHSLIEDLLLLSRIESAKEPLKMEELELGSLIGKMKDIFAPLLREKSVRLEIMTSSEPITVQADSASMERALCNLVDNAVKYNKSCGKVFLRVYQDAEGAKIEVSDTGIGISPPDLSRIFERFYRADKSRSRESGGTGLGLSIARHILERHGGRIEVESAPHQGSTFTLILPLA